MARFVQITGRKNELVWINADLVTAVGKYGESEVDIYTVGDESPWIVPGTVAEVVSKLQGEQPQPPKAADDIVGWWCENVTGAPIYVIGEDSCGFYTYEMEENLVLRSRPDVIRQHYFRDPNRKGWEA